MSIIYEHVVDAFTLAYFFLRESLQGYDAYDAADDNSNNLKIKVFTKLFEVDTLIKRRKR